jgi:hypothetical protein
VTAAPLAAALAAAMTAVAAFGVDNNSYVLPHTLSAPLGIALTLALIAALAALARTAARRWAFAAGAALGALLLTRPDAAAAALAAAAAWAALRLLTAGGARRRVLGDLAVAAAPALAIPGLVYGALLTRVSAHDLVRENLVPSGPLHEGAGRVLRISAPLTPASFGELGGRVVLYAAGAAVLTALGAALAGRGRARRSAAIVLGVGGIPRVGLGLVPFIVAGPILVAGYNLELLGGRLHGDFWFAAFWGAFPALTGFFAEAETLRVEALLVAAGCFAASVAQRRLSTPVRELRRRTVAVQGEQRLADGRVVALSAARLAEPLDAALAALSLALPLLAAALVVARA